MDTLNIIAALDALAQEHRLAIFRLLTEMAPKGLQVGELATRVNLPPTTLAFHLDKLSLAGLVDKRRDGRATVCTANTETLVEVIRYLSENCCRDGDDMPCRIIIEDKSP